jgi:hypothetical protein
MQVWGVAKFQSPRTITRPNIIGPERNVNLICTSLLYTHIPKIKSISQSIAKKKWWQLNIWPNFKVLGHLPSIIYNGCYYSDHMTLLIQKKIQWLLKGNFVNIKEARKCFTLSNRLRITNYCLRSVSSSFLKFTRFIQGNNIAWINLDMIRNLQHYSVWLTPLQSTDQHWTLFSFEDICHQ